MVWETEGSTAQGLQDAKTDVANLPPAANEAVAERVATHLGLFDEVIASTTGHNLKGAAKAEALVARFSPAGFVYAGDARADLIDRQRPGLDQAAV